MEITMNISDGCRQLARSIRTVADKSLHESCQPLVNQWKRHLFDRMMAETHKRIWTEEQIGAFAAVAATHLSLSIPEILDHLLDPGLCRNNRLAEMIRGEVFRENSTNIPQLEQKLTEYFGHARKVVSWQRPLPVRFHTEEIAEADIKYQQKHQGFSDDVARAKKQFAEHLADAFQREYEPGKTRTVVGMLRSAFDDLRNCTGIYCYAQPEDANDCLINFAEEAVSRRAHEFRRIDDRPGSLPEELENWIDGVDGVVCVDDRFMMKLLDGGARRVFLERTGDRARDSLLDHELRKTYELLRHTDHDPGQNAVIDLLRDERQFVEQEARRIRQENLERMRGEQPSEKPYRPREYRAWVPE